MAEQTPLETLTEMNERIGKRRKRRASVSKNTGKSVERFYRTQLNSLVRAIRKDIEAEIMPILKAEKDDYLNVGDSADTVYTKDAWSERVIAAISLLSEKYLGTAFQSQYKRLAAQTVSMAEAESTKEFTKSVNRAVGVDMGPILTSEGMADYVEAAAFQNTQLIKSVPEQMLDRVQNTVIGGIRDGDAPTKITRNIQELTGVTRRQAERIARDQTAKLTSEITERRQRQAGIKYYRVVTAGDERVTGNPAGKYPNAKISCYGIARQDVGYGPGVYRWDTGAKWGGQSGLHPGRHHPQCRCVAASVFEWELPKGVK